MHDCEEDAMLRADVYSLSWSSVEEDNENSKPGSPYSDTQARHL